MFPESIPYPDVSSTSVFGNQCIGCVATRQEMIVVRCRCRSTERPLRHMRVCNLCCSLTWMIDADLRAPNLAKHTTTSLQNTMQDRVRALLAAVRKCERFQKELRLRRGFVHDVIFRG